MSTILLGGATGFIGSHLTAVLRAEGHTVVPLSRRALPHGVRWDAERGTLDTAALARAAPDVVINLSGEPIAQRWTPRRKRRIRDSRVNGTSALASAVAALPRKPAAFIGASAVGYYGAHRGDEVLDENSAPGGDFVAAVAQEWENATAAARDAGIRVAISRTGVVLDKHGGLLARILLPFRLGLGGRIGDGSQWLSWISMDDLVRGFQFLIASDAARGAFNLVAPEPCRNVAFTRALGRVLRRPTILPIPAMLLRLVFSEMANDTILASQRVTPKRLAGAGFEFRHPQLEAALRSALRRSDDPVDR